MSFAAVAALSLSACAIGPGEPFATVTGTLTARAEATDTFTPLSTGYEVKLTGAAFSVDALRLAGVPEGASDTQTLLAIPSGLPLVALGGDPDATSSVPLTCDGVCALDRSQVTAANATLTAFEIVADVRDTRQPARIPPTTYRVSFVAKPTAPGPELSTDLSLLVDRFQFPNINLDAAIVGTPQMFEGIDFAALSGTELDDTHDAGARNAVLASFATTALDIHTERSP